MPSPLFSVGSPPVTMLIKQATVGDAVERRGHPRRDTRRLQSGPHRHEIAQTLRQRRQRRRDDPRILAASARRQQHAEVAKLVRRLGDLAQIVQIDLHGRRTRSRDSGHRHESEETREHSRRRRLWSRSRPPHDRRHHDGLRQQAEREERVGDALLFRDDRFIERLDAVGLPLQAQSQESAPECRCRGSVPRRPRAHCRWPSDRFRQPHR